MTVQDKLTTMMAKKESILKEKEDAESVSRAKVWDIYSHHQRATRNIYYTAKCLIISF